MQAARGTILTGTALVVGAFLVSTFQMPGAKASRTADDDDQPKTVPAPPSAADSRIVVMDRSVQAKGGIETSIPQPSQFQDRVSAYGTVLTLDRLTGLYNASLINAAQLKVAEVKMAASQIASERAQNLLKVFPTAKAQAESADAAYLMDAAQVGASKAQVEALRNNAVQDWGNILGAEIAARGPLAEALVLRKLCLVQLSLPADATTTPPQRISLTSGEGGRVTATFVSDAIQVDPKIQGRGFLYVAPTSARLVSGASVRADLPRGGVKPGLEIPPSAVVWQSGKAWMYVRTAPDKFERRPLDEAALPKTDGGYIVPARSLLQDEDLVVVGAQILLSQESRAQIPSDEDDN